MTPSLILSAIGAYLLGAVPFGLLFARLFAGKDLRQHGSGNIGATNALRAGGKLVGAATLLADIVKGTIPVAAALAWGPDERFVAVVALAAFFGHIFPVYLKFRGGKGVATMFGVLIPWAPWLAAAAFALWLLLFFVTRYVSLASIAAGASLPLFGWLLGASSSLVVTAALLGGVMIIRHSSNIRRLLAGVEPKTGGGTER